MKNLETKYVQAPGYSTSVITGTDITGAILWSYKCIGRDKFEKLPDHQKAFRSVDDAWEYARKMGYSIPYTRCNRR